MATNPTPNTSYSVNLLKSPVRVIYVEFPEESEKEKYEREAGPYTGAYFVYRGTCPGIDASKNANIIDVSRKQQKLVSKEFTFFDLPEVYYNVFNWKVKGRPLRFFSRRFSDPKANGDPSILNARSIISSNSPLHAVPMKGDWVQFNKVSTIQTIIESANLPNNDILVDLSLPKNYPSILKEIIAKGGNWDDAATMIEYIRKYEVVVLKLSKPSDQTISNLSSTHQGPSTSTCQQKDFVSETESSSVVPESTMPSIDTVPLHTNQSQNVECGSHINEEITKSPSPKLASFEILKELGLRPYDRDFAGTPNDTPHGSWNTENSPSSPTLPIICENNPTESSFVAPAIICEIKADNFPVKKASPIKPKEIFCSVAKTYADLPTTNSQNAGFAQVLGLEFSELFKQMFEEHFWFVESEMNKSKAAVNILAKRLQLLKIYYREAYDFTWEALKIKHQLMTVPHPIIDMNIVRTKLIEIPQNFFSDQLEGSTGVDLENQKKRKVLEDDDEFYMPQKNEQPSKRSKKNTTPKKISQTSSNADDDSSSDNCNQKRQRRPKRSFENRQFIDKARFERKTKGLKECPWCIKRGYDKNTCNISSTADNRSHYKLHHGQKACEKNSWCTSGIKEGENYAKSHHKCTGVGFPAKRDRFINIVPPPGISFECAQKYGESSDSSPDPSISTTKTTSEKKIIPKKGKRTSVIEKLAKTFTPKKKAPKSKKECKNEKAKEKSNEDLSDTDSEKEKTQDKNDDC